MGLLTGSEIKFINELSDRVSKLEMVSNGQSKALVNLISHAHSHGGASGAITTDVSETDKSEPKPVGDNSNINEGEKGSRSKSLQGRAKVSSPEVEKSLGKVHGSTFPRAKGSNESPRP